MNIQAKWAAVVVDWDGTMARSQKVYYGSIVKAFEAAGIVSPPFRTFCHEVARMGVPQFYEHYHLFDHINERDVIRIRNEHVEEHWGEIVLRHDAHKLFTACAHTRVPLIVMSSNEARVIEQKLAEYGASSCVKKIITTDNKGTALAELAVEKKSSPKSLLFVDDSSRDLRMAKQVGTAVAGFTKGYGSTRDIREAGPHFFVQSLRGVAKLVMNHREQ